MTLYEHAREIWGGNPAKWSEVREEQKLQFLEAAYVQLNMRLDEAQSKIWQLEWDLSQEKGSVGYLLPAIQRIADALGMEGARYSEIADKALSGGKDGVLLCGSEGG